MESRESALYGSAFDSWPTPGLLLDAQLVIIDADASYLRALGRAEEDTDGLVERRGISFEDGFEWLRSAAEVLAPGT